jgi:dTDP-4-amino-4,6-dideoxygalactose transaminase
MDEIQRICTHYEIPLVEDAAEALGSQYKGQPAGSFGILSALSFNGNKIITTSGGGALLSHDEKLIAKARFLATQARDDAPHYEHSHIGYNYRMSNVLAGIGRGQLTTLSEKVARRRAMFTLYREELGTAPGISFVNEPEGFFSNRWLTTVLIDPRVTGGISRETVRTALARENIETRPLWKPLHLQPVFRDFPFYGDGLSERLFADGLCLPSGSNMTESQRTVVIEEFQRCLSGGA